MTLVAGAVVIFLFLGNLRATLIPAVTIPVSIVAAAIVMAALGYSINMLTLLGAVLAIGLVVDDAIVVLENIVAAHRARRAAAARGDQRQARDRLRRDRDHLVLMAVFVPISFLPGNVGRLFSEFGVTVAAAWCSRPRRAVADADDDFEAVRRRHPRGPPGQRHRLMPSARLRVVTRRAAPDADRHAPAVLLASSATRCWPSMLLALGWPWAGMRLPTELAPPEDRGRVHCS